MTILIEKLPVSLVLAQGLAANFASGHVSSSTILIVTSTVQHNEFLSLEGTEKFATFLVATYFIISKTIIFNVKFVILMMSWYYIYFPLYDFIFLIITICRIFGTSSYATLSLWTFFFTFTHHWTYICYPSDTILNDDYLMHFIVN